MAVSDLDELEVRARRGDRQAFGQLARLWDDDLRAVVWSVLRDRTATDDAMQASYEKALRGLDGFRGDASLKTWLHSICWRTAIDLSRSKGRRHHAGLSVVEAIPGESSTSDSAIGRVELAAVLGALEPETRSLLMLTVGLGYSYDEVAAMVNMPRGTVASRVGRAREALRDARLTPEELA